MVVIDIELVKELIKNNNNIGMTNGEQRTQQQPIFFFIII